MLWGDYAPNGLRNSLRSKVAANASGRHRCWRRALGHHRCWRRAVGLAGMAARVHAQSDDCRFMSDGLGLCKR